MLDGVLARVEEFLLASFNVSMHGECVLESWSLCMESVLKSWISSKPDDTLRGFPGVKVSAVPIITLLTILKDRAGDIDLENPPSAFSRAGDLALAKLKAEDHFDCRLLPAELDPTGEREEPLPRGIQCERIRCGGGVASVHAHDTNVRFFAAKHICQI